MENFTYFHALGIIVAVFIFGFGLVYLTTPAPAHKLKAPLLMPDVDNFHLIRALRLEQEKLYKRERLALRKKLHRK